MVKKVIKSEINVPLINLYLSKRAVKFEIRITFTEKTKFLCNVSVKLTQTLNFCYKQNNNNKKLRSGDGINPI